MFKVISCKSIHRLSVIPSFTFNSAGGLPKRTQTFLFFQIQNVTDFRKQLYKFKDLVTTATQALKDRGEINTAQDEAKRFKTRPKILVQSGVNISFTQKAFVLVR